jgi:hypothetical protein
MFCKVKLMQPFWWFVWLLLWVLGPIAVEGDTILVILATNSPALFSTWSFANRISDISLTFSSFQSWNALKVS